MSRIASTFAQLAKQGRKALIPFVTAGYPSPGLTPVLMHAMVNAGADVIELGVPFSDPSADGPLIQKASDLALSQGVGLSKVLEMVSVFRSQNKSTPVVLMGYANPIERYEQLHSGFARDAAEAGVDGVLVVDYPPEEIVDFAASLRQHQIDLIFLLAPTSTDERILTIAGVASGYVYYVSLKGVTGSGTFNIETVNAMLPRIRRHLNVPVGVGFGIRDAQTAHQVAQVADAVVIGSRIVELIDAQPCDRVITVVQSFLSDVRAALDT